MAERARTFQAPAWWLQGVQARVDNRKTKAVEGTKRMSQQELATALLEESNLSYDAGEISRCISGEVVPQDMAEAVSRVLKLPLPWFVPITEDEARRFEQQRDLTKAQLAVKYGLADQVLRTEVDPQLATMKAGVDLHKSRGQTDSVKPEHGSSSRRKRGRVGGAGR